MSMTAWRSRRPDVSGPSRARIGSVSRSSLREPLVERSAPADPEAVLPAADEPRELLTLVDGRGGAAARDRGLTLVPCCAADRLAEVPPDLGVLRVARIGRRQAGGPSAGV